jgi:hypothetical protein
MRISAGTALNGYRMKSKHHSRRRISRLMKERLLEAKGKKKFRVTARL